MTTLPRSLVFLSLTFIFGCALVWVLISENEPDPNTSQPEEFKTAFDEESDDYTFKVNALDYEVEARKTKYKCFTVPILQAGERAYITGFSPSIDEKSDASQLIHHYIVSVAHKDSPTGTHTCVEWDGEPIWAWVRGNEALQFPQNVGMELGGDEETRITLQVHYDNPFEKSGVIDDNGITIHYKKNPTEILAGMLTVGSILDIEIPPHTVLDYAAPRCLADDTSKIGPITLFVSTLHAHEFANAVWLDQYRNGELLTQIDVYDPWDAEAQRAMSGTWDIQPGDELAMNCRYTNTVDIPIEGGVGAYNEMCLAFLMYYPKSPYNFCGGMIKKSGVSGLQ